MIRKFSLLLTIIAALGLVVALLGSCGKKGPLQPPEKSYQQKQFNRSIS